MALPLGAGYKLLHSDLNAQYIWNLRGWKCQGTVALWSDMIPAAQFWEFPHPVIQSIGYCPQTYIGHHSSLNTNILWLSEKSLGLPLSVSFSLSWANIQTKFLFRTSIMAVFKSMSGGCITQPSVAGRQPFPPLVLPSEHLQVFPRTLFVIRYYVISVRPSHSPQWMVTPGPCVLHTF